MTNQILIIKDEGGVKPIDCPGDADNALYWIRRIDEIEVGAVAGATIADDFDWIVENLPETPQAHNPRPGAEYGVYV